MSDYRKIESLPTGDDFWNKIDNKESRDFFNCLLLSKIRGSNPKSDEHRIELIAQLNLLVELIDAPKGLYEDIKAYEVEQKRIAELHALTNE